MASKLFHTFDEFWEAISDSLKTYNYPSYHPCCKVWVTRAKKACRDSHTHKISWGAALASQGFTSTDSKHYLQSHLAEHQWGPPIRLNVPCSARVTQPALNNILENTQPLPQQPQPQPTSGAFFLHQPNLAFASPQSTPAQYQNFPSHPELPPLPSQDEPQPTVSQISANL